MREFPRIMTDVNCGWKDDVGSSITSSAVNLARDQQQACEGIRAVLEHAESLADNPLSYQSMSSSIHACKID